MLIMTIAANKRQEWVRFGREDIGHILERGRFRQGQGNGEEIQAGSMIITVSMLWPRTACAALMTDVDVQCDSSQ
jgi:transketolase C-terminal domain/subunit